MSTKRAADGAPAELPDAKKKDRKDAVPADETASWGGPEFAPPGEEHKILAPLEGKWHATVTIFMGPDKQDVSEGEMVWKWCHGGRFLSQEYCTTSGSEMMAGFTGGGYMGFNKAIEGGRYLNLWVDSMASSLTVEHGTYDAATRMFTFRRVSQTEVTKEKDAKAQTLLQFLGDDVFKMTSQQLGDDGEYHTVMTIDYKRLESDGLEKHVHTDADGMHGMAWHATRMAPMEASEADVCFVCLCRLCDGSVDPWARPAEVHFGELE
eukprot:CAMPEP_0196769752 /NCGR_PEP_ID=MMETSP1104-20130614/729_1 /TAXON_ID=33652 /ORGANISM="Cafeteria sp., Strain Caron Lab Isolate" /LENGTH=264 /DNA_ID=CAMNT_0042139855 /DNA_START=29 /DNA_END=822 /DNA_ORIENTATION=+